MNHWSSGIRVARGGSDSRALIRNTENSKWRKYTQNGYETVPQNVSGTISKKSSFSKIPVSRKPVFILNFYLKLNWNYDVILKICFSGVSYIFHDIIHYHHTKFRIDIICLKKVTVGSLTWNTALALLLFVCEYLGLHKCKLSVCVSQVGKNPSEIVWITFSDLRTR